MRAASQPLSRFYVRRTILLHETPIMIGLFDARWPLPSHSSHLKLEINSCRSSLFKPPPFPISMSSQAQEKSTKYYPRVSNSSRGPRHLPLSAAGTFTVDPAWRFPSFLHGRQTVNPNAFHVHIHCKSTRRRDNATSRMYYHGPAEQRSRQ